MRNIGGAMRSLQSKVAMAVSAALFGVGGIAFTSTARAAEESLEEVVVTGIKASLERGQDIKREAVGVVDAISAEALGKFPDTNIAESLQRIPGIAIDRNGGEGQFVTVRGFGPSFNTVLVNGRRIVSETGGREFSFDLYPAELISGAEVYKSGVAHLQEGGIGATINLHTARPLDMSGDTYLLTTKGLYDDNSGEATPQVFGLASKLFNEGRSAALLSVSYQERESQEDYTNTNGWLPTPVSNLDLAAGNSNPGNVTTAFIPRETQTGRRTQSRERLNIQSVFQHDFNDHLRLTVDGLYNDYKVESSSNLLGSWFGSADAINDVVLDAHGTVLEEDIASEIGIMNRLEGRPTETKAIGFNLAWSPADELQTVFDVSWSESEALQSKGNGQAVMGWNTAAVDPTRNPAEFADFHFSLGSVGQVAYNQAQLARLNDPSAFLSHVAQFGDQAGDGTGGNSVTGKIMEFKVDNVFTPADGGMLSQIRFGAAGSEEKKSVDILRPPFSVFCLYCFFPVQVPSNLLHPADTADVGGAQAPFLRFNLADYIAWQSSAQGFAALDACNAAPNCNPAVPLPPQFSSYAAYFASQPGGFTGTRQPDSFDVNERLYSIYADATLKGDIRSWGWTLNTGVRFVKTKEEASGAQQTLVALTQGTATQYNPTFAEGSSVVLQSENNDYQRLLPNMALTLKPNDNINIRLAVYESMARPELRDLAPRFSYADLRPNSINAFGGNVNLKPYTSTNWDLGLEYYWGDLNYVTVAYFEKEVRDFIVIGTETVTVDGVAISGLLASGQADPAIDAAAGTVDVNVQRPLNAETAKVEGVEVAAQFVFDFGLGFSANATFIDSNAGVSSDSPLDQAFAIPGLGDSMNATVFYENRFIEARVSWSSRDEFLESLVNPKAGVEPVFTDEYEQIDARLSYHFNDKITLFLEGTNLGDEAIRKHGRFDNQFIWYSKPGPRYALGFSARL